jgi:hypothetical protein
MEHILLYSVPQGDSGEEWGSANSNFLYRWWVPCGEIPATFSAQTARNVMANSTLHQETAQEYRETDCGYFMSLMYSVGEPSLNKSRKKNLYNFRILL